MVYISQIFKHLADVGHLSPEKAGPPPPREHDLQKLTAYKVVVVEAQGDEVFGSTCIIFGVTKVSGISNPNLLRAVTWDLSVD